ncbi:MAG: DNA polymerase III subunit beta [Eubacteriales bacterium]|nr:DNA polymerase III subunit beta [Eubacteriales bacterium]
MKFICQQQILIKALNTVSKAVTSRSTLPILKGILLNLEGNKLKLLASDLDLSIEKTIDIEDGIDGSVVVQSKLFMDIIRKLPSGDIIVEEEENNTLFIKSSKSEFRIVGLSAEEFPSFGEEEGENKKITFDKEILKEMIRKTSFSASIDESKGVITGILTELKNDSLNMVSLDGFRMAIVREKMENKDERKIIISAKIMNEIGKIISESEGVEKLDFFVGEKKAIARLDDTKIVMRLLDGEFIKYKDILPKEHKCKIKVSRDELFESIERASIFSREGKNNLIKVSINEDMMTITSRSEEGKVKEELAIEKEGINVEIGFNSKYVLDAIKVIDDEEVIMEFNASVNPCLVKPVEGDKYEYLILPVRINNAL